VMFVWVLDAGVEQGGENEQAKFGILRPDGSTRPAYNALAAMPK